ncbi:MAG: Asp-tRNA(Asn)/Glu-tRNA(Gln) amidotransferase subunit GatB [Candidatus Omnitrophica bacterium]|nr:Asp-tRNA(Asn)/Glu-tRNA(Gln) amidotransferase subunit GatB [Candidatus Omnitrophota bacterium]
MAKSFETVIGLEVHVQPNTNSKIFCPCPTEFNAPANTHICPVCCGYPGVLPVFNKRALELAVRTSLALHCTINEKIYFERKNYFYPDLPKNYQISQYALPLGENGHLELSGGKKIGITRVHLEEDAGKLIHREDCSLVDFNRTGTPLLEIVSYPDMNSPQEAWEYLQMLKLIIQYIEVSSCDMEKGYLRCDANISLREEGATQLGTKIELKNMNSFKGVKDALVFEEKRQRNLLLDGKTLSQETRLWDEVKGKTVTMRTKEEAHDYRYFPEPDLVSFSVTASMITEQRQYVPELPLARTKRFIDEYGLSEKDVEVLISHRWSADFFEQSSVHFPHFKQIANWIIGPLLEITNAFPEGFSKIKMSPGEFAKLVRYFSEGTLNNITAKKVLTEALTTGVDIDKIIQEKSLIQVSDESELDGYVSDAVAEHPKSVEDYRKGKSQALMFLVGSVMKKTKGKANPKIVREMIEKKIQQ